MVVLLLLYSIIVFIYCFVVFNLLIKWLWGILERCGLKYSYCNIILTIVAIILSWVFLLLSIITFMNIFSVLLY